MPEFLNPFPGRVPDRKLGKEELVRALRLDLAAEHEAVHLYLAHADACDDPLAEAVLRDIADEERKHIGEFMRLILILTGNEQQLNDAGAQEVEQLRTALAGRQRETVGSLLEKKEGGLMGSDYQNRAISGIGDKTWEVLERAAVGAAKSQLTARRFISIEGPHGLGVQAVPLSDVHSPDGHAVARLLPLHYLFRTFGLSLRDIAAYEREPLMLDAGPAAVAAIECARAEEELIYTGTKSAPGLMGATGIHRCKLASWQPLGKAASDVVDAVNLLDAAGFHGPYALAMGPARYNLLYRLYPDGNGTELAHVEKIVGGGVFKAPALKTGGLLLATGAQFAAIILGQDLCVGYVGRTGPDVQLSVSESLALLLREPRAVCALED